MKCYASHLDVCHNSIRCEPLGKCFYERELKTMDNQTDAPIHHFSSGASSSGNLPPYECLTITLLKRAAFRMQKGMHYGKHNWKKGSKDKQFILDRLNHAIEHLIKAAHEIDDNIEMVDDDLAAVVVNCMFAMEYQNFMNVKQKQTAEYQETAKSIRPESQKDFRTGQWNAGQSPGSIEYAGNTVQSRQLVINPAFEHALRKLINIHGIDNQMNIADNSLASLLVTHLHKIKGQMY